ncbi:hypothetical protein [Falsarthrobacter nasiphocae]|uniref:Uncharacterized protein n=1 Tax=Falsarthrobacter nasiphocae TaxID=189863 RepID=A0AAE3YI75_9MICC|nr:hypothetical protein [Falsarthrobacter nasiphocae]MDR6892624.1 hypothetical protein [Falsarthrobacter nasiphocae]
MNHVSRRQVSKGAAWAAPAMLLVSAAPSASASPAPETTGNLIAVPWSNTFGTQKNNFAADNTWLSYVMYPSTPNGTYSLSAASVAANAGNPNGSASFPPDYSKPTGAGQSITITVTRIAGTNTYASTPRTVRNATGDAWPFLVLRDSGWYSVSSYSAVGPTNGGTSAEYSGVPGTDAAGNPTWTWTLTFLKDTVAPSDGSSAITFDLFSPPSVGTVQYQVATTSPWGSGVFTSNLH